jgi:hypothetical protein
MRTRATDGSLSSGVERDDSATRRVESIARPRNDEDPVAPARHRGCQPLCLCGG